MSYTLGGKDVSRMSQKRSVQTIQAYVCKTVGSSFLQLPLPAPVLRCGMPAIPACQPKTCIRVFITAVFHQEDHCLSLYKKEEADFA